LTECRVKFVCRKVFSIVISSPSTDSSILLQRTYSKENKCISLEDVVDDVTKYVNTQHCYYTKSHAGLGPERSLYLDLNDDGFSGANIFWFFYGVMMLFMIQLGLPRVYNFVIKRSFIFKHKNDPEGSMDSSLTSNHKGHMDSSLTSNHKGHMDSSLTSNHKGHMDSFSQSKTNDIPSQTNNVPSAPFDVSSAPFSEEYFNTYQNPLEEGREEQEEGVIKLN